MKHRRSKPRRKQSKNVSYKGYQPRAGGNGKQRADGKRRLIEQVYAKEKA